MNALVSDSRKLSYSPPLESKQYLPPYGYSRPVDSFNRPLDKGDLPADLYYLPHDSLNRPLDANKYLPIDTNKYLSKDYGYASPYSYIDKR